MEFPRGFKTGKRSLFGRSVVAYEIAGLLFNWLFSLLMAFVNLMAIIEGDWKSGTVFLVFFLFVILWLAEVLIGVYRVVETTSNYHLHFWSFMDKMVWMAVAGVIWIYFNYVYEIDFYFSVFLSVLVGVFNGPLAWINWNKFRRMTQPIFLKRGAEVSL